MKTVVEKRSGNYAYQVSQGLGNYILECFVNLNWEDLYPKNSELYKFYKTEKMAVKKGEEWLLTKIEG